MKLTDRQSSPSYHESDLPTQPSRDILTERELAYDKTIPPHALNRLIPQENTRTKGSGRQSDYRLLDERLCPVMDVVATMELPIESTLSIR